MFCLLFGAIGAFELTVWGLGLGAQGFGLAWLPGLGCEAWDCSGLGCIQRGPRQKPQETLKSSHKTTRNLSSHSDKTSCSTLQNRA